MGESKLQQSFLSCIVIIFYLLLCIIHYPFYDEDTAMEKTIYENSGKDAMNVEANNLLEQFFMSQNCNQVLIGREG